MRLGAFLFFFALVALGGFFAASVAFWVTNAPIAAWRSLCGALASLVAMIFALYLIDRS